MVITLDSSFSPPPNFYALRWGVDLARDTTGPVADGNAAFLLRRSLYTLPMRMQRINQHGIAVARYLDGSTCSMPPSPAIRTPEVSVSGVRGLGQ